MLEKQYIENILDYAISAGADYAEVFFEDAQRTSLSILNEQVTECNCGQESGIGIRIFKGMASEYLYSADTGEGAVFALMKKYWKQGDVFRGRTSLCDIFPHNLGEIRKFPGDMALNRKADCLKNAVAAGMGAESCIVQGRAAYVDMDQKVQIANTEGTYAEDRRVGTRVRLTMVAEGEGRQSGFAGSGAMLGADYFEKIDLEQYARTAARSARSMLGARPSPVGKMPVIIANGFGGLFFHEACGHSLEGSSVADGCSEFAHMLGKHVASEKVTLVDDGTMPGEWGSLGIDDEGIPTRKNVLIENGVLKGYLLDRLNARRMGMEPTGSARRQNYRFAPVSRMTNTYIEAGTDKFGDMICSVGKGLFVKEINAGSVDPVTGEFNFNTGETYLIEHGEITVPLTSATLVGTGMDILRKVDMVSDNFALGQGYCYAGSGQLRIGAGQPAVRITEMTVGGKDL